MTKLLTVIGATGTQGASVIDAMLPFKQEWSLRAITRDPTSQVAQVLQSKGVQVVRADLSDAASLKAAFEGSYAVFAVTDFFTPFALHGLNITKAKDTEWTHCANIIEVACSTPTLQHFIWSSLPHAARNSRTRAAGQFRIPHFEGKNRVEDQIKAMPDLLAKTTFVWVGWYASNFQYPIFKPTFMETAGTHILTAPVGPDTPISTIGDVKANLGKFIRATLQRPDLTLRGRVVSAVIAQTSTGGLLQDWSKVTGNSSTYLKVRQEDYERLWGGFGQVEGANLMYYEEFGVNSWSSDVDMVLTAQDLGLAEEQFVGVEECLKNVLR